MRPVAALDFDDVFLDFVTPFLKWHNDEYGTVVTYADVFSHQLDLVFGTSRDEMFDRIRRFSTTYSYVDLHLLPGAVEAVRMLGRNFELHIVTARTEDARGRVADVLARAVGTGTFAEVHCTHAWDAQGIRYAARKKSEVCRKLGTRFFVDDALPNVVDVSGAGIPVFLPDRPWNQSDALHPEVTRCFSWAEIVAHVQAREFHL